MADHSHTGYPAHGRRQTESDRAGAAHGRWPPELSGLWHAREAQRRPARRRARSNRGRADLMAEREKNFYKDGPQCQCLPQGAGATSWAAAGGMRRIVQSPSVIAILNGDLTYRQIFTDGRALESDPLPIWMGYSVGHWDHDTLVVESNGFNDKTWLHAEGLGHTEKLRDHGALSSSRLRPHAGGRHVRRSRHVRRAAARSRRRWNTRRTTRCSRSYATRPPKASRSIGSATRPRTLRVTAIKRRSGDSRQVRRHVSRLLARQPDHGRSHARGRRARVAQERRQEIPAARAVRDHVRVPELPVGSAVHLHSRGRRDGARRLPRFRCRAHGSSSA